MQKILAEWSAPTPVALAQFSREQEIAFLVNAHTGFGLKLILTRLPQLTSIKKLGFLLQSP